MADIHFFGKPNCRNNEKQKQLLKAAGHTVLEYDILTYAFTEELLYTYFGSMEVVDWFNVTAPAIKNGSIVPSEMNETQALQEMLADRLLIRRPLMQIGNVRLCGFDREEIVAIIDLQAEPGSEETFTKLLSEDVVTCPNAGSVSCDEKGEKNE